MFKSLKTKRILSTVIFATTAITTTAFPQSESKVPQDSTRKPYVIHLSDEDVRRIKERGKRLFDQWREECRCPDNYIIGEKLLSPDPSERKFGMYCVKCIYNNNYYEIMVKTCDDDLYYTSCIRHVYYIKAHPTDLTTTFIEAFKESLEVFVDSLSKETVEMLGKPSSPESLFIYESDGFRNFIIKPK